MDQAKAPPSTVSRSVERAFGVFSLIAQLGCPVSTRDVRTRLALPQASAHALLRDLTQQGWLNYDAAQQTFFPSIAFARLGNWLEPALLSGGLYARYLDGLGTQLEETVSLATVTGGLVEILAVRMGRASPAVALREGIAAPLVQSATGAALLALFPPADRQRQAQKLVSEILVWPPRNAATIIEFEEAFAARKAGAAYGVMLAAMGVIALDLPALDATRPVVAVVAGFAEQMKSNEAKIAALMVQLRSETWEGQANHG